METTAVTKNCSICGVDLRSQKRVKDPAGRYYCRTCYAAVAERPAATARARPLGADGGFGNEPVPEEVSHERVVETGARGPVRLGRSRRVRMVWVISALVVGVVIAAGLWITTRQERRGGGADGRAKDQVRSAIPPLPSQLPASQPASEDTLPKTSATAPLSTPPPNPPTAKAAVSGEVWIALRSGETLPIASERVFLLPTTLPLTGDEEGVKDVLIALEGRIEVGRKIDDAVARAMAERADHDLQAIKQGLASHAVPAAAIISASVTLLDSDAVVSRHRLATAMGSRVPGGSDMIDRALERDHVWQELLKHLKASAMTGREGKFTIKNVLPGSYVLACRVHRPTSQAVIYWSQPVELAGGADESIDFSSDKAVVISY
jgi:hypothetical protein